MILFKSNSHYGAAMPHIKIFLLSIAFVFVIYFMYFLNTTGIENTQLGTLLSLKGEPINAWDWCSKKPTRISWKNYSSPEKSFTLELKADHWILNSHKLNLKQFPAFKDWMFNNCQVELKAANSSSFSRLDHSIEIAYSSKEAIRMLLSRANSKLKWDKQVYQSEEFYSQLISLEQQINEFSPAKAQ